MAIQLKIQTRLLYQLKKTFTMMRITDRI